MRRYALRRSAPLRSAHHRPGFGRTQLTPKPHGLLVG